MGPAMEYGGANVGLLPRVGAHPQGGRVGSASFPRHKPSTALSLADRFPKDFWLSARTVLTRQTPISKLNHFCVRHGFFLSDLAGFTADDKRGSLFRILSQHDWPDGYDGYMRALNEQLHRVVRSRGSADEHNARMAEAEAFADQERRDQATAEHDAYLQHAQETRETQMRERQAAADRLRQEVEDAHTSATSKLSRMKQRQADDTAEAKRQVRRHHP